MSKTTRKQHAKHQSLRKHKSSGSSLRRHLTTLDLIASSLVAIIFTLLLTLSTITLFSSISRPEDVLNSGIPKATPAVSIADLVYPIVPSNKQEQLIPQPVNDTPLDVPTNVAPVANTANSSKLIDDDSHLNIASHTPDFVEEQVAANHPFDLASQTTQAQAGSLPSSHPTDFGFTGQRKENFGLMDYGGRFYSPALGRFISSDPIVPDYTNPQALNRYSYVYNNPVKFTDPSGHCIAGLCPGQNIDHYETLMESSTSIDRYEAAIALNAALPNAPDREPWNTGSLRAAVAHDAHLVAVKEGLYADQTSYWNSFMEDAAAAGIPMAAANAKGDQYVPLGSDTGIGTPVQALMLPAPKMHKHHIFNVFRGNSPASQKYRDFFKNHNIDVNTYTVEVPDFLHKELHRAGNNWTTRWKNWIDENPKATTKEVYQFAGKLMDEYGLNHLPIEPY